MVKKYLDASESEEIKNKQFEKLRKENSIIRDNLRKIILEEFNTIDDRYDDLWILINQIVNNEIEQERLCNQ